MILIAQSITKTYHTKTLFKDISLHLNEKDKVAIIGNNGCGKTTLLKILAGLEEPETGIITTPQLTKISYLSQSLDLDEELTVIEEVFRGISSDIKDVEVYEAKAILSKLGLNDLDKQVKFLSGGQKRRLALASTLIRQADILILDEVTNHLDGEMILWLEKYLKQYNKAIIMVTHDRYFLERIVSKIFALENGQISEYDANYSKYLELKIQNEEMIEASNRKKEAFLRKEWEWIKRGPRARVTKDRRRIENYELLSSETKKVNQSLNFSSNVSRLGKKIIEIKNVSKRYDQLLFKNFTLNLTKDARIGLVGKNGVGKTTLLNIIAGKIAPDEGSVEIGETARIGYFSQEDEELKDEIRIIDYVKNVAEVIPNGKSFLTATQMIERFLFDNPYSLIGTLSGGEKRRLILLGILMSAPNVLLLDEPTNNLDLATINILEEYLEDFKGAVIISSHDRYFLDKVTDEIYAITDEKQVKPFLCSYSEYLSNYPSQTEKVKKEVVLRKNEKPVKLTFKEQIEYQNIEDEISLLEEQLQCKEIEIQNQVGNYDVVRKILDEKMLLESQLEAKIQRWAVLSEIVEKMK